MAYADPTLDPSQTPAECARLALTIMDRDGWNKGYMTKPVGHEMVRAEWVGETSDYNNWNETYRAGSHCVGGLWNLAMHGDNGNDGWSFYNDDIYQPVLDVIGLQNVPALIAWNNSPETAEQDVRRVLESLANA